MNYTLNESTSCNGRHIETKRCDSINENGESTYFVGKVGQAIKGKSGDADIENQMKNNDKKHNIILRLRKKLQDKKNKSN